MKFFSFPIACALTLAASSLAGCKKEEPIANTGNFTLHLENTVGATAMVLGTGTYKNANGDDFTVSTFKYYISNVKLNRADNTSYAVPNSYFLVDQADDKTQDLTMANVPVGDYTSLSFTVGVDSARTKAGSFTDALNANNGMYWDMNGPEFINVKLEGYSPQAPHAPTATTGGLIFHVAGYKHSTTNTIRTVTLPFPTGVSLLIRADHSPEVHTQADAAKMFAAPNMVNFGTTSNIMGGTTAARFADNIAAGLFTVEHIHAN